MATTILNKRGLFSAIGTLSAGQFYLATDTNNVYIGTAGGNVLVGPLSTFTALTVTGNFDADATKLGFFGTAKVVKTAVADPVAFGNADNEIGGLTISDPPTQVEVQALRDKCEELADDCRGLQVKVTALIDALQAVGLV